VTRPVDHDDFAVEPIPGLPARPPQGEAILWQGSPEWRPLAITALHVRKVFGWFALLGLWQVVQAWHDGTWTANVPLGISFMALLSLVAAAILCGLAAAISRTTVYTITDRRVVMRFGVALPMTINLPFAEIDAAGLRSHDDGTGDIALTLAKGAKLSALILWPHVRPWHYARPEPILRCIPDAAHVAALLGEAFVRRQPARVAFPVETAARAARPALAAAE
jgi:hypothetical protein